MKKFVKGKKASISAWVRLESSRTIYQLPSRRGLSKGARVYPGGEGGQKGVNLLLARLEI